jgi:hypothetical protein
MCISGLLKPPKLSKLVQQAAATATRERQQASTSGPTHLHKGAIIIAHGQQIQRGLVA